MQTHAVPGTIVGFLLRKLSNVVGEGGCSTTSDHMLRIVCTYCEVHSQSNYPVCRPLHNPPNCVVRKTFYIVLSDYPLVNDSKGSFGVYQEQKYTVAVLPSYILFQWFKHYRINWDVREHSFAYFMFMVPNPNPLRVFSLYLSLPLDALVPLLLGQFIGNINIYNSDYLNRDRNDHGGISYSPPSVIPYIPTRRSHLQHRSAWHRWQRSIHSQHGVQ